MKLTFESSCNWWKIEDCAINRNDLPWNLQPEEFHGPYIESMEVYFYPLYFPIGMLIKYMQDNGFNLELVY